MDVKVKFISNLVVVILLIYCTNMSNCEPCRAAVELSEFNFDKFINKFQNSIVKFDIAFPYGENHNEFCNFCMEYNYLDNLLCGLVGVKDYGDKDNAKLVKKYGVQHADDFPAIKLFSNHTKDWQNFSPSKDNAITVDNLIRFIQSYGEIKLHLKGCIPELNELTEKFLTILRTSGDTNELKTIIEQVSRLNFESGDDHLDKQKSKDFYLKLLTKILKDNLETKIIGEQLKRLNKLKLEKNVSVSKLQEFNYKINILNVFQMYAMESFSKKNLDNKVEL